MEFKVPHLRNAYQKVGMFGMAPSPFFTGAATSPTGDQVRGSGFLHDGSVPTITDFLSANVFNDVSATDRDNLEALIMAFDTNLAPIVGQQVTLSDASESDSRARAELLIARAGTPFVIPNEGTATECDLPRACTGPLNACTAQLPACVHPVGCDAGVCLTAPAPMNAPCDGGRCNGAGTCSAFCDPTRSGLRACYRFEGGLLDESAFGNHATSVAPRFDAGVAGRAWLVGDAGADSRDDVSLDCTTALTMESWVYPEAFPTASGRTGVLDNDGQYGLFIGAGGELRCAVGLGLNVPGALTLQTWQHVACIKSGSSLKAYVNGLQVGSTSSPGALSQGTTAGLRLGQNSPSGDVFAGALDGLRIWCEAIPVAELCSTPGGCG